MRLCGLVHGALVTVVICGLFMDIGALPVAIADANQKIETALLNEFSVQGTADFIVRFCEQPDLSAAYDMEWLKRGDYVLSQLQDTARRSQTQAKSYLDAAGFKYKTFMAGNKLYVWKGDITAANSLAKLTEVESIRQTCTYSIDPLLENKGIIDNLNWASDWLVYDLPASTGEVVNTLAWGIAYTKADDFWVQFDLQGDGMIVANIDTGVQWDHPALIQSFRCRIDPSDSKCWEDPSNI